MEKLEALLKKSAVLDEARNIQQLAFIENVALLRQNRLKIMEYILGILNPTIKGRRF